MWPGNFVLLFTKLMLFLHVRFVLFIFLPSADFSKGPVISETNVIIFEKAVSQWRRMLCI